MFGTYMGNNGRRSPAEPHPLFTPNQTRPLPLPGPGYFQTRALHRLSIPEVPESNFAAFGDYDIYDDEYDVVLQMPFCLSLPARGAIARRRAAARKETVEEVNRRQAAQMDHERAFRYGSLAHVDTSFKGIDWKQQRSVLRANDDVSPKVSPGSQTAHGRGEIRASMLTRIRGATARRTAGESRAVVCQMADLDINNTSTAQPGKSIASGKRARHDAPQVAGPCTPEKQQRGPDGQEDEDGLPSSVQRAPRKKTKFVDALKR